MVLKALGYHEVIRRLDDAIATLDKELQRMSEEAVSQDTPQPPMSAIDLYISYYRKLLVAYDVVEDNVLGGKNTGYKQEATRIAFDLTQQALMYDRD